MEPVSLFPYNETALKSLIYDAVRTAISNHEAQKIVKPAPELVGIKEAAKILLLPKLTIYKRIKEIPHYKPGRNLMFKPDELLAWIETSRKMTKQETENMVIEKIRKAI